MQSKKAFIKLDGKIGEKEMPCVEYIDNNYIKNMEMQKIKIKELLSGHQKKDVKKSITEV
jgi:DNA-binding protein